MSLPKAVFLVSKAEARPPGIITAGALKSKDFPSASKNFSIEGGLTSQILYSLMLLSD